MAALPMPVSNNAVCAAKVGSNQFVYSFGGIGSTRSHNAITKRCFVYDVLNDRWDSIPDLPSKVPLIALAASNVRDTIYICGGYSVDSMGNEKTNASMFRFVPAINSFISAGPDVPVPVDDQVQITWRDSLLYLITGWSNTANVADVQIYNPIMSSWFRGSPVTQNNRYRSFGASGIAIGDTIYYLGGAAMGSTFNIQRILRRGIIDASNPSQITWSIPQLNTVYTGYRMAALTENNVPIWIGDSSTTYNFDGIAYNGSGPVTAEDRTLIYLPQRDELRTYPNNNHAIMDLRGVGDLGNGKYILCGGMKNGPMVSSETWMLDYSPIYLGGRNIVPKVEIIRNAHGYTITSTDNKMKGVKVYDAWGRMIKSSKIKGNILNLNFEYLETGIYYASIFFADSSSKYLKLISNNK